MITGGAYGTAQSLPHQQHSERAPLHFRALINLGNVYGAQEIMIWLF
ncbi:MAG: hypothetical protein IPM55_22885 [Acidobacteria bacterium]|nr:hypothetical protein [Acidobacteriota bacterium]